MCFYHCIVYCALVLLFMLDIIFLHFDDINTYFNIYIYIILFCFLDMKFIMFIYYIICYIICYIIMLYCYVILHLYILYIIFYISYYIYYIYIYYIYILYFIFKYIVKTDISAGLTPLILLACASVNGFISFNFCLASRRSPLILL